MSANRIFRTFVSTGEQSLYFRDRIASNLVNYSENLAPDTDLYGISVTFAFRPVAEQCIPDSPKKRTVDRPNVIASDPDTGLLKYGKCRDILIFSGSDRLSA